MKRLPITVRELVANSPFQSSDGTVFIGWKHTHVFAVDPLTGTIHQNFSTRFTANDEQDLAFNMFDAQSTAAPPGTLFIGRADYSIRAIESTGVERYHAFDLVHHSLCANPLLTLVLLDADGMLPLANT
jgi:hypothetical protein